MSRTIKSIQFFGIFWLLCFSDALSGEPFFTKEESLYSNRTGNHLAYLIFSVSSQPDKPNEYVLSISNAKSSNTKCIWIFEHRMSAERLKRADSSIKVKDIAKFSAFCENREVRFILERWEKIKTTLKMPFSTNVSEGGKISLMLYFYVSSQDKKKTIIKDEATVKLEFLLPPKAEEKAKEKEKESENDGKQNVRITTLDLDLSSGNASCNNTD